MSTGAWVLLAAVVLALAFGSWRAYVDGRFRGTHAVRGVNDPLDGRVASGPPDGGAASESSGPLGGRAASVPRPADLTGLDVTLGERATLLQFSSAFCAPCRATRRVLADVAAAVPGVVHVEVDAEQHLDVVRRLGILRTPTTLVLDADGVERARAAGAPTKVQVLSQLAAI